MDFLEKILNCSTDEEVDLLVKQKIEEMNSSKEPIEQLGFIDSMNNISSYEGFIPLNTRIKYASLNLETYSMNTTDFFYDFAHFLKKNNINNKGSLIYSLETFINFYFGYPGKNDREDIFNANAWNSTTTDEEFFEALRNNKIGDLKGAGAAECTERSALAQQLLSMYGTEIYYCMGCVGLDDKVEEHCFNIVKRKDDYAILDYSIPLSKFNNNGKFQFYIPFVGIISNEEFKEFINSGVIKSFSDYEYHGNNKVKLDTKRKYRVGKFNMKVDQEIDDLFTDEDIYKEEVIIHK